MSCSRCGTINPDGMAYCGKCGLALYQTAAPAQGSAGSYPSPNLRPVQGGGGGCLRGCLIGCLLSVVLLLVVVGGTAFWINSKIQRALAFVNSTSISTYTMPSPEEPTTAWDRVRNQINSDQVDLKTATQAFALAFGPLPGVTIPAGLLTPISDGTGPLHWLLANWDRLTPLQQTTALSYLTFNKQAATNRSYRESGTALVALKGSRLILDPGQRRPLNGYDAIEDATLTEHAQKYIAAYSTNMSWTFRTRVTVYTVSRPIPPFPDPNVFAVTHVPNVQPARCDIYFYPISAKLSAHDREIVLAHEIFHCFQDEIVPNNADFKKLPPWMHEGSAEWASLKVAGGFDDPKESMWPDYLKRPGRPLTSRSYDGVGFYAHAEESGVNVWTKLVPMLQSLNSERGYQIMAGPGGDRFLNSWASGYFRDPSYGSDWDMTGPGILALKPAAGEIQIGNASLGRVDIAAYANAIYNITAKSDITGFKISGTAHLSDNKNIDLTGMTSKLFCTDGKKCMCPPGSKYSGPPLDTLDSRSRLALTGGTAGAQGFVFGMSLQDLCDDKPVQTPDASGELCQEIARRMPDPWFREPMTPEAIRNCVAEYMQQFVRTQN